MHGSTTSRWARVARLPLLVLAATLLVGLTATSAQAGEIKKTDSDYTNGDCQSYILDADCFHDAGLHTTHQGCVNEMGAILDVDPDSDTGKFWINQATWMCQPTPPTGDYRLSVWQSSPPCEVGLPFSECPKG